MINKAYIRNLTNKEFVRAVEQRFDDREPILCRFAKDADIYFLLSECAARLDALLVGPTTPAPEGDIHYSIKRGV